MLLEFSPLSKWRQPVSDWTILLKIICCSVDLQLQLKLSTMKLNTTKTKDWGYDNDQSISSNSLVLHAFKRNELRPLINTNFQFRASLYNVCILYAYDDIFLWT